MNGSNVLEPLQARYGSVDYNKWEAIRQPFWSHVQYPLAGAARLNFFGQALGAQNLQLTNLPKAGSFGQNHFLLQAVRFAYYIQTQNPLWPATVADADTFTADLLTGFFQAGYAEMVIGAKTLFQICKPFLTMPRGTGRMDLLGAGFTAAGAGADNNTSAPWITPVNMQLGVYVCDPPVFIAAEQNFEVALGYPAGLVPVISTTIITAGNPLFVSCTLDGILYRPVQ